MLQEQSARMEEWRVSLTLHPPRCTQPISMRRETNIDDVLQISNVFTNVSKGEVAKSGDLQKAFGTTEIGEIVKEVGRLASRPFTGLNQMADTQEGRDASRRKGARS